jgi:hypothetical protein
MVQVEVRLHAVAFGPKYILAYERFQELEIRIWYANDQKSACREEPM